MSSEVGGGGGSDALRSTAGAAGGALAAGPRRANARGRGAEAALGGSPGSGRPPPRDRLLQGGEYVLGRLAGLARTRAALEAADGRACHRADRAIRLVAQEP